MKLADAVVQARLVWDVRYVFGVSGANIEHLHDAIHRLGDGRLVSVMAKSEFGAAFMADGYARVHRRLGVCCSTSGGGMMNLAVGIAESHAESVSVLALVGQPPARGEGRGGVPGLLWCRSRRSRGGLLWRNREVRGENREGR